MGVKARASAEMAKELRQFGAAHARNGERRTSDLLYRAADHIDALEDAAAVARKRIERLVEAR